MADQTTRTGVPLEPCSTTGSVTEKKYYWALAEAELKKNEGVYADFQKIQRENRCSKLQDSPEASINR
jgi:hypothetical protein